MHGMMSSSWSSWPMWVCNHRSRPGASFITVICMWSFIFVTVRHCFQYLLPSSLFATALTVDWYGLSTNLWVSMHSKSYARQLCWGLIWVAAPFHAHLLWLELRSAPWDLRSIDEISIVNFIHFQVKTFSPVHTWILPGFRFVSRTCHEALSIILWQKVLVSVFFTVVTVQKCAKNALFSWVLAGRRKVTTSTGNHTYFVWRCGGIWIQISWWGTHVVQHTERVWDMNADFFW